MIVYGTQYYRPPFPEEACWESDLRRIKEVHFNTVKLWAVWSWIERKEGELYFDDLDEIIRLCGVIGLNVVLNIIPEGAPYWLIRRHPGACYTTAEGFAVQSGGAANMPSGGSPGLCADDGQVADCVDGFIAGVADRYARVENVIALDVWNEPHLEPIFDFPERLFCYCEASQRRFVEWLQARYGGIAALNRAWLRAYQGWEDVSPPVRYGTYPDMIDWRLFWIGNLASWLDRRVAAARAVAKGKAVMTHVPFSGYFGGTGEGGLGYHLGDEFILAPRVDVFGLTSFPKWLMENDPIQHLLNLEMVASSACGRDFWQSELQSGAGKWEAAGRPAATPQDIRLWNWSALACGAKGIMYWQWRPEPSGLEAPGFGLTGLDGSLSPRTRMAGECAQAFNRLEGLDRASRVPAVNGIFVSRSADLWWHAAFKGEAIYAGSLYGAYRACFLAGIPVRMVHADHLAGTDPAGLQVLYLPAAVALSDQELAHLAGFVEAGGTLVSEACPGLFDETGVLRGESAFLNLVLGLSGQELDAFDRVDIEPGAAPIRFSGRHYRQDFGAIRPGTGILACYSDGRPAVFERRFGRGLAVLAGTFAALQAGCPEERGARDFITRWMNPCGYALLDRLEAGGKTLIRLHRESSRIHVTAVNYSDQPQTVKAAFHFDYRTVLDGAGKSLSQPARSLEFSVGPNDGAVITLEIHPDRPE